MEATAHILKSWRTETKRVELQKENGGLTALVTDHLSGQQWKLPPSDITYRRWTPVPPLAALKRALKHTHITLNSRADSFHLYIHQSGVGGADVNVPLPARVRVEG